MGDGAVHYFPDSARFGRALARALRGSACSTAVHHFPDGESLVRVRGPVSGEVFLVRALHDPNAKIFELLLAADALRREGAKRVTLVAPYLPYMRQDAVFRSGEGLSQRVFGELLGRCFDRVVTVEPHLHRVASLAAVMPCEATTVSAAPAFVAWLARRRARPLLIGPDEESEPWLRAIAGRTGLPVAVGRKRRTGDRRVRVVFPDGLPAAQRALIVDDIASSGATVAETAQALRRAGIRRVDVAIVHAIFADGALERMRRAGVQRVVSCDTVPHPTNALRLAPAVAAVLSGDSQRPSASVPGRRRRP
jgi:ribose-phosphate pyrophosphokinase